MAQRKAGVATDLLKLFFGLKVTSVVLPITDRKRPLVNSPRIIWFTEWSGSSFIMFYVIGDSTQGGATVPKMDPPFPQDNAV